MKGIFAVIGLFLIASGIFGSIKSCIQGEKGPVHSKAYLDCWAKLGESDIPWSKRREFCQPLDNQDSQ